ncbi:MAG TPA: peptidase S10, partial [Verrucomicrobiales bacterium]|nr:peptidase S10 [Verrucomicrobiales bacterium]
KEEKKEDRKTDSAETKHQISIDGQALTYTATASTLTLTKPYGEPRAKIFHVSYIRTGAEASAKRPVCFCFNGGPGSSSVWLHLGAFGPRRVVLPEGGVTAPKAPYALTDNEYTLLRDADLVFVDPVSTGLSMPEKGEDPKQFFGFNEDVESIGEFVRLWITKNNRWGSPKFLLGESYGAIRVSGLASHLQDKFGMYLNGVVIVSGLLDFKTLSPDDQNDVPFIAWLPGYTANAYYHKKLAPELMGDFQSLWTRVREFARGAYANALLRGASLPAEDKERIAAELSALTSLPKDYILRENLRIDPSAFRQKLLEKENKVIGRYDGRVAGVSGDPSYNVVFGAFATLMNIYLRDKDGLNYQTDRPYEILNGGGVNPWNYGRANRYFDVCSQLGGAITDNPNLQVFIACGYHDLATPAEGIEGSVRHINLPQELRGNFHWGFYDGGHMMYTNLPSLKKVSADISAFMKEAAK